MADGSSSEPAAPTGRAWKAAAGFLAAVFVAAGAVSGWTQNLLGFAQLPPRVTYVGVPVVIGLWCAASWYLKRRGLPWSIAGRPGRLTGLGPFASAAMVGLVLVLALPAAWRLFLVPKHSAAPTVPPLIDWSALLLQGETLIAVPEGRPTGRENSFWIPGQRYTVRFRKATCEWVTVGPIRHPTRGLVKEFMGRAGPRLSPHLGDDELTVNAPCVLPSTYELYLFHEKVAFDTNGGLLVMVPNPALGNGGFGPWAVPARLGHLERIEPAVE